MKKSLLASLNDADRLLIAETERRALQELDEDEALELQARIRRARNKYSGQHRRSGSARVAAKGRRGPADDRAAIKAEAFEEALARVSRQVAKLAKAAADQLRDERLAAAQSRDGSPARPGSKKPANEPRSPKARTNKPVGDRSLRSPAREKNRAGTRALGAKRQAKKDAR